MYHYKAGIEVRNKPSNITILSDSALNILNSTIEAINDNLSTRDDYWVDTLEYKDELLLLKIDDDGVSISHSMKVAYLESTPLSHSALNILFAALNKQLHGEIYVSLKGGCK